MAVVTDWRPADPCRPTVCPVDAASPTALAEPQVDLAAADGLTITHTEGFDVAADNFYPAPVTVTPRHTVSAANAPAETERVPVAVG
jgi:hypothetical protein